MSEADTPRRAIVLLACSVVLSACAQLLMKAGMLALQRADAGDVMQLLQAAISDVAVSGFIGAGLLCYALSMLAWLLALTGYRLSIAYPMLGISYVLVYLGAIVWERIGEEFSLVRSAGIVLVLIGVVLVNSRDHSDHSNMVQGCDSASTES
jgi:undecaprenyl phosphate-alpha-L-ara4N flippase subunit ArnF